MTGDALVSLALRPLELLDVPFVAAIHVTAFAETSPEALGRAIASLEEELARPWAHVRVACLKDEIVGATVAWVVADEVHVLDVATRPDVRRRGIGRALVADVIDLARLRGAMHAYLEVRRSNVAAIALYRGAGFAARGLRRRYYSDDEDAVEMALTLDPATRDVVARSDEVDL